MITIYGYAKDYKYDSNGQLYIKVRIPQIHGAYNQKEYKGQQIKNYVLDEDLPYYQANLLGSRMPKEGDIVSLQSNNDGLGATYGVVGLTGAKYNDGTVFRTYDGTPKVKFGRF